MLGAPCGRLLGGTRFAVPCLAVAAARPPCQARYALVVNTVTCAVGARRFAAPKARAQSLTSAQRRQASGRSPRLARRRVAGVAEQAAEGGA